MSLLTHGYEPYHSAFILDNLDVIVELNPLAQPIFDGQVIGFNCWWRNVFFDPENISDINILINALKEQVTITKLINISGLQPETVQTILQTLYEVGVIQIVQAEEISALAFYRHVVASMRSRRHKMLQENPLIALEQTSTLSRRLLLGLLVEGYHFSSSAASHISLAIAQTRDKAIEETLSRYLSEEYWHGNLLAKGILKAGVNKEDLQRSVPSFPVLGIINFLRDIARTDVQAYGLCLALTESNTSSNALLIHKQEVWDMLKSLELVPEETLEAFYEHDKLDYTAKHDDLPEMFFQKGEKISAKRQKELLHITALYIEMVGDAYKYLKAHYASPEGSCWFEIK